MKKLVSIIIPCYNSVKYLDETIESILAQTYKNWEAILINDGSTDGTAEHIDRLAASDTRIVAIHQENGRQGKARNNGIRHAKGELIAFLDSDDIWVPEKLTISVDCLLIENVDLVFSDGFICLDNSMDRRDHTFKTIKGFLSGDSALDLFYRSNQIPVSTVLCRKDALFTAGLFEENPGREAQGGEDYAVWVAMLQRGLKFYGMEQKTVYYRVHGESSTSSELNQIEKVIGVIYNFSDRTPEPARYHLLEKYRRLFEFHTQAHTLKAADALVRMACNRLFDFPWSAILSISWKLNPNLFLRIFWRLSARKLRKEQAKGQLLVNGA